MIGKFKESSTFKICLASWLLMSYMWVFGGVESTLTEYGMATAAIWALWRHREHYNDRS